MELNSYQREVMGNLSAYLSALNETGDLNKAWQKYWSDQDVAVGLGTGSVPGYRQQHQRRSPCLYESADRRR